MPNSYLPQYGSGGTSQFLAIPSCRNISNYYFHVMLWSNYCVIFQCMVPTGPQSDW